MGTTTTYVHIYKPGDSEVFDQQLNDNANYDLIDAAILTEHNLILAHANAVAPHSGHASLGGTNLFTNAQSITVNADAQALLLDTQALAGPGVLNGGRLIQRAHCYDVGDHRRDFIWRARTTSNGGAGILELLTALDGGSPTVLWSMSSAGVLGSNAAAPAEIEWANRTLVTAQSVDLTNLPNIMEVFVTAGGVTVTLPDARSTNRPVTVYGAMASGQASVAATFGTVYGGSANLTTGAIQNGVVVAGDSFRYKADGTNWRS